MYASATDDIIDVEAVDVAEIKRVEPDDALTSL